MGSRQVELSIGDDGEMTATASVVYERGEGYYVEDLEVRDDKGKEVPLCLFDTRWLEEQMVEQFINDCECDEPY